MSHSDERDPPPFRLTHADEGVLLWCVRLRRPPPASSFIPGFVPAGSLACHVCGYPRPGHIACCPVCAAVRATPPSAAQLSLL